MSSQVTYFTSIDSQYRDDNQYPLETDFGVSFKIKDPYATYPNGEFFYPSAQQESQNIGAYNPPGLNPGVGVITGSNLPYAKGTPYNSNKTFPRVTIDKNYTDTPITVKGGIITQMVEVDTSLTTFSNNYTVTFCGLLTADYDANISFGVIVNDVTFWTYQYTGNKTTLFDYSYPYICSINYNTEGGLNRFEPGQLIIMDPSSLDNEGLQQFNRTEYIDIQYTDNKNDIFMIFDFTIPSFYFARVNPNINYQNLPNYQPGLVSRLPTLYEKLNINFNPNNPTRQISTEVSQCLIVGFNSDLNNLTEYENFPWGSHQFFTYPNPIDILPSKNGSNQLRLDGANNIYAAVHTNPFNVNYSIANIPEPCIPLFSYLGQTFAIYNSKPLATVINLNNTGTSVSYRNTILCSTNIVSNKLFYDVDLLICDTTDIIQNPPLISPYTLSLPGVQGSNAAAFFGPKTNGIAYMALNVRTVTLTNFLRIYEISGGAGTGTATLKINTPLSVCGIDAYDTPVNPDFTGLPMLAVIEGTGSTSSNNNLKIYSYNNVTPSLNLLATKTNAGIGEGCCIVNIIQTTVPDENIYIALGTIDTSSVIIYKYESPNTLTFVSKISFPDGTPSSSNEGLISQIYNFKGQDDITVLAVTFDQKSYIANYDGEFASPTPFNFKLSGSNLNPVILENNATYNVPFTTTNNSTDHHYILGSNIYTSVGNIYTANALPGLLQYQVGNSIDIKGFQSYPENCWYSFMNGYYFGFTRSETNTGANRIYMSQSSAFNSSTFYGDNKLISKHSNITTVNSGLPLITTPIGNSAFTFMSPLETTIPELVCPTVAGPLVFYDLSTYPIITNKYETNTIFSNSVSWINFNTIYNNQGQGSMYIGGSDGEKTYFANCINYDLTGVYSTTGSCSQLYKDSFTNSPNIVCGLNIPYTTDGPTLEIYDVLSGNLINSTVIESSSFKILNIQYMNFINSVFGGSYDVLAIVLSDLTISKYRLRFFNLNTYELLVEPNLILDVPTDFENVSCSSIYNRYQDTNDLFIETKIDINGNAIILTYHFPLDIGALQLPNVVNIDNSRLLQKLEVYGENLGSTINFLRNQNLMSAFVSNQSDGVNLVAIYDTTSSDSFTRVAEIPVGTTNPNYAQQTMYTISSNGKTLLFVYTRENVLQGGTITISDITNPILAGKYANGTTSLQNAFPESINGKGTASIVSISADGSTNWINNIGDSNLEPGYITSNKLEDPAYYDSQFINISGLDIDTEQINLYLSTDWQTKISVVNPYSQTGSQLILRSNNTNVSNSSIIKITTSQGNSVYLTPIEGSNDVYSVDIIKGQNTIIGLNLLGTSTTIFQPQFPYSYYVIPTVIQNVITTTIPNNSTIVSFDSDTSIYNWSSKIQTNNLSTVVSNNALGYNANYIYLIGSSDSNQIDFYSSNTISQSWIQNQEPNAEPKLGVPYVFISKYDYSGNYLESDIIDPFSYSYSTPTYVFVGKENIYATDVCTFPRPFFYYLQRNKDGTLANFLTLDVYFTGTDSSGNVNTYYTNTYLTFTTRYKINSNFIDTNGSEYSTITMYYDDTYTGFFDQAFLPYATETLSDLTNKYIYLPSTSTNYTIRNNYYNPIDNTFNVILNQIIPTNLITRIFPTFTIYPNIQKIDTINAEFYNYFYIANLANGKTYSFGNFTILNSTNLSLKTSSIINTSDQYYIITNNTSDNHQTILPIQSFVPSETPGLYTIVLKSTTSLDISSRPGWTWITSFNSNALYTLQFYPASLTEILYYTVRLTNLTIPNRPIRNSTITGGPRYLTDYRYIWLEIYNADDNGTPDPEIVNNTFSNNPNRNAKVIFQIPITSAGGFSNYSFLFGNQQPRLKFNPGFYNIRIRLLDPNNQIIIFENSPSKNNVEDNVFTNEVDKSLMNITVDLELTNILRA